MRNVVISSVLLLSIAGAACSKSEQGKATQKSVADSGSRGPNEPQAKKIREVRVEQKPTIEGMVRIEFAQKSLAFRLDEVAKGIHIDYKVVVDKDVPNVIPRPQDAGSGDGPDGSGLIIFEKLSGNGQSYSQYDRGMGQPRLTPVTIKKGVYPHTFQWDGKNWSGPSDYGVPEGPPFPSGVYTLCVSAIGEQEVNGTRQPFRIEANIPVTLEK